MHKSIVINTSPLISLVAGLGSLEILHELYKEVRIQLEVYDRPVLIDDLER